MKKTIGAISYSLIEHANVIYNPGPGVQTKDVMDETARELKKLASQLPPHLNLIPRYAVMARIFGLPLPAEILAASRALIGLSNGVHEVPDKYTRKVNATNFKTVCDSLGIYNVVSEEHG